MKNCCIVITLFLVVLLQKSCQNAPSGLEGVVYDMSAVSRLVNGISLKIGLEEGSLLVEDVIAEMLNAPKEVAKLGSIKPGDLLQRLNQFLPKVKAIKYMLTTNLVSFKESLSKLNDMKDHIAILNNPGDSNMTKDIKNQIANAPSENWIEFQHFNRTLECLDTIRVEDTTTVDEAKVKSTLSDLKLSLDKVQRDLKTVSEYENTHAEFLKLENAYDSLKNVVEYGEIARTYIVNNTMFMSIKTETDNMQSDISDLTPFFSQNTELPDLVDKLGSAVSVIKTIVKPSDTLKLTTTGFPEGEKDIEKIKEDFDEQWLPTVISGGKSLTELETSLSIVFNFGLQVAKVRKEYEEMTGDRQPAKQLEDVHDLLKTRLAKTASSGDVTKVTQSLTEIIACTKDLKAPSVTMDFTEFDKVISFVERKSEMVKEFKTVMKTLTAGEEFSKTVSNLTNIKKEMLTLHQASTSQEFSEAFTKIKTSFDLAKVISMLNKVRETIEPFQIYEKFGLAIGNGAWNSISSVLRSLSGTELPSVVGCLNRIQYDMSKIDEVIEIRSNLEDIKNKDDDIANATTYVKKAIKVMKTFEEVKNSVKPPKTRRRRGAEAFPNLEDAQTKSRMLGRGVQILRDLNQIHKEEKSILGALNVKNEVHSKAENYPGASQIWTQTNRNDLKTLVNDLKKLDKSAQSIKKNSLSGIFQIFEEADKTVKMNINAKLLRDPISTGFAADADPDLNAAAQNFRTIGGLNLKFSSFHSDLNAAANTLPALQTFFDRFFGTSSTSGSNPSKSDEGIMTWIIVGSGVLVTIIFLVIGYILWKKRKPKVEKDNEEVALRKRWENRDRLWLFDDYNFSIFCEDSCEEAIRYNALSTFKRDVEKGCLVNRYTTSGDPLLHLATIYNRLDMVECLIKNGADRSAVNRDGVTAGKLAKGSKNPLLMTLFENLERNIYSQKPPVDLPISKAKIIIRGQKNDSPFMRKYDNIICTEKYEKSNLGSHIVVPTDEDGIYDMDKYAEEEKMTVFQLIEDVTAHCLLVKWSWIEAMEKDENNFEKDVEHLVTKVKVFGKVYERIDEWKAYWTFNRNIPLLAGIFELYYETDGNYENTSPNMKSVRNVMEALGCKKERLESIGTIWGTISGSEDSFWFPTKKLIVVCEQEKDVEKVQWKVINRGYFFFSLKGLADFLLSFHGEPIKEKRLQDAIDQRKKAAAVSQTQEETVESKRSKTPDKKDGGSKTPDKKDGGSKTPDKKDGGSKTPDKKDGGSKTPDKKDGGSKTPEKKEESKLDVKKDEKNGPEAPVKEKKEPKIKAQPDVKKVDGSKKAPEKKAQPDVTKGDEKVKEPETKAQPEVKNAIRKEPEQKANQVQPDVKNTAGNSKEPENKAQPEVKDTAGNSKEPENKAQPDVKDTAGNSKEPENKAQPDVKDTAGNGKEPEKKANEVQQEVKKADEKVAEPENTGKPEVKKIDEKVKEPEQKPKQGQSKVKKVKKKGNEKTVEEKLDAKTVCED